MTLRISKTQNHWGFESYFIKLRRQEGGRIAGCTLRDTSRWFADGRNGFYRELLATSKSGASRAHSKTWRVCGRLPAHHEFGPGVGGTTFGAAAKSINAPAGRFSASQNAWIDLMILKSSSG